MMKCVATRSPTSSCRKKCTALLARGKNVSPVTVTRHMSNEFGAKSHKPASKPYLTSMKSKRSNFAKKYDDWTAEQ